MLIHPLNSEAVDTAECIGRKKRTVTYYGLALILIVMKDVFGRQGDSTLEDTSLLCKLVPKETTDRPPVGHL
jgi:hypothetical protein